MSLFEQTNITARTEIGVLDGGRASAAAALARGTARLLHALGFCTIAELPLASGRRADLVGLGADGEIVIVEIKSSVADFRADHKWLEYRRHCDRLFFATAMGVPLEIFPADAGLIVADAFGAAIERNAPEHRLAPATRRSMTLRFARAAALRLESGLSRQDQVLIPDYLIADARLSRRALREDALQGAPVHVEPARRLRDVAAA